VIDLFWQDCRSKRPAVENKTQGIFYESEGLVSLEAAAAGMNTQQAKTINIYYKRNES
jgi:hypothetical protein